MNCLRVLNTEKQIYIQFQSFLFVSKNRFYLLPLELNNNSYFRIILVTLTGSLRWLSSSRKLWWTSICLFTTKNLQLWWEALHWWTRIWSDGSFIALLRHPVHWTISRLCLMPSTLTFTPLVKAEMEMEYYQNWTLFI